MRIKRWKEMSEREVVELKRNQCMKCVYLSKKQSVIYIECYL